MAATAQLVGVDIEGFKCFNSRVSVGPLPGASVTAIVGPNGAGKSVLGEAIAFALGGNKKMLRARTLGALINQQRAAQQQGCNSASVTLRFSTSGGDSGGGEANIVVERSLRGSKVATRVCCLGEGQTEAGAGGSAWRQLTQDQLHDLLLPLGINTKAVDRYVVTQARQAVDVQDPLGLVAWMELMLGTTGLADALEEAEQLERSIGSRITEAEDDAERLEARRGVLAPAVRRWAAMVELEAAVAAKRRAVLSAKESLVAGSLEEEEKALARLQRQQHALASVASDANTTLGTLERQDAELLASAQSAESQRDKARRELEAAVVAAAEAEVQAKSAAESEERAAEVASKRVASLKSRSKAAAAAEAVAAVDLAQLKQAQQELRDAADLAEVEAGGSQASHAVQSRVERLQRAQVEAEDARAACQLRHVALVRELQQAAARLQAAEQSAKGSVALAEAEAAAQRHMQMAHAAGAQAAGMGPAIQAHRSRQQELFKQQVDSEVELRAAEQAVQASGQGDAAPGASNGWRQRYDQAVSAAHAQIQGFHGRLANVLHVHNTSDLAAVNAVLAEVAAPHSTMVVHDRAGAYAAVAAFRDSRTGSVTCKVLSELQTGGGGGGADGRPLPSEVMLPGGVRGTAVAALVGAAVGQVPLAPALIQHLFGSWVLVDDRAQAMAIMTAQGRSQRRRWSLVTRAAEVFKSDGEIVVRAGGARPRQGGEDACDLGLAVKQKPQVPTQAAHGGGGTAAAHHQSEQKQQQVAARQQAAQSLQAEVLRLDGARRAEEQSLQAAMGQQRKLQQEAARASKAASAAAAAAADLAKAAVGAAAVSAATLEELRAHFAVLQGKLDAKAAEMEACSATSCKAAESAAAAMGPAAAAKRELVAAASRIPKAEQRLGCAQRQAQRLASQLAAAQQQQQLASAGASKGAKGKEKGKGKSEQPAVAQLSAWHAQAAADARRCDEALGVAEEHARRARERSSALTGSLRGARRASQAAAADLAKAQAGAAAAAGEVARLREEGQRLAEQLAELLRQQKEKQQQEQQQQEKQQEKQQQEGGAAADDATMGEQQSEGGADADAAAAAAVATEHAAGGRRSTRAAAATAAPMRTRRKRNPSSGSDSNSSSGGSDDAEDAGLDTRPVTAGGRARTEARLRMDEAALHADAARLEQLRPTVDASAVEKDRAAAADLRALATATAALEASLSGAVAEKERLADERYACLSGALGTVSSQLSRVYQFLTGGQGDAYLQYTADRHLLFTMGVVLCVRPDARRWRPFSSLSGGQQALSTLALAFATQAAFPSPFYVLDEVDAALDTLNAEAVADYMRACAAGVVPTRPGMHTPPAAAGGAAMRPTQFIVVSHKPQVFEKAQCLVGVYTHGGASRLTTAFFPEPPKKMEEPPMTAADEGEDHRQGA
ncbi:hypothetical protein FOA52_002483 [Chlamydomonas sp. UWO 241]|nr:hypothetical protein FOA52_002483 [Chlamydomonas sp. UWO 241]